MMRLSVSSSDGNREEACIPFTIELAFVTPVADGLRVCIDCVCRLTPHEQTIYLDWQLIVQNKNTVMPKADEQSPLGRQKQMNNHLWDAKSR